MNPLSKTLIIIGLVFIGAGLCVWLFPKVPGLNQLGKLPGDIHLKGEKTSFYFPVVSCIVVSILLTILFRIFRG